MIIVHLVRWVQVYEKVTSSENSFSSLKQEGNSQMHENLGTYMVDEGWEGLDIYICTTADQIITKPVNSSHAKVNNST